MLSAEQLAWLREAGLVAAQVQRASNPPHVFRMPGEFGRELEILFAAHPY
jgi:hypothetical protein